MTNVMLSFISIWRLVPTTRKVNMGSSGEVQVSSPHNHILFFQNKRFGTVKLSAFAKYIIPKCFSHGQHLSAWLCHDENQRHKITHEVFTTGIYPHASEGHARND